MLFISVSLLRPNDMFDFESIFLPSSMQGNSKNKATQQKEPTNISLVFWRKSTFRTHAGIIITYMEWADSIWIQVVDEKWRNRHAFFQHESWRIEECRYHFQLYKSEKKMYKMWEFRTMTCLLCILDLFHRCCKTVFSSSPAPIAIAECGEPNKQKCEDEENEWIEAAFVAAHILLFFFGWELIWWCCDSQRQWSWWWWNENFGFIFRNGDVFCRLPEWIFPRFFSLAILFDYDYG